MQQLHFAGEVRSAAEIEIPKADVKPAELKLAQQLIESQTSERFDPVAYKDHVRERVEGAIQRKVEGAEISVSELAPAGEGKVIDLMEALRASLEKTETARTSTSQLGPRKAAKRVEEAAEKPARKAGKAGKR
jgi:DNA end-binding protein Ku